MTGALIGVGVGPGDPELLTRRAVKELQAADRVVVPDGGRARAIVLDVVDEAKVEAIEFSMHEAASRSAAWDVAGTRLAELLGAGETVAFATLGDPNVYSTFHYVAQSVRAQLRGVEVRTTPGITAMQDLAARASVVLAEGVEDVRLVAWTAGEPELRAALAGTGTVVVYKGGRELEQVLACIEDAGRLDDAVLGVDLGTDRERVVPAREAVGRAPYMSTVVVPARREGRRGEKLADRSGALAARGAALVAAMEAAAGAPHEAAPAAREAAPAAREAAPAARVAAPAEPAPGGRP